MLDAAEATDLVRTLAARGLVGRSQAAGGLRWVEVLEAREDTDRLLADVAEAASDWLAGRERASLEIRVEDEVHHVTAQIDLREVLHARVRTRTRRQSA